MVDGFLKLGILLRGSYSQIALLKSNPIVNLNYGIFFSIVSRQSTQYRA